MDNKDINKDTIEILTETIAKVEGQLDTLHILIDQHRKDLIGVLQAVRQDMETDQTLDVAEKTNKNFELIMKSLYFKQLDASEIDVKDMKRIDEEGYASELGVDNEE